MAEEQLNVNRRIRIPLGEFHLSYVRSSGPGGQNVNKVATKVQLRWNVTSSPSLPDDVRERFLQKYRRRITTEGIFVISSQRYRDQKRNVEDCFEKLRELLAAVATAPKQRKRTKPTRASVNRRLEEKKKRSKQKETRRKPQADN